MNLYIQTVDGQAINHPAFEDNLIQVFGTIPSDWEPFIRVEKPIVGLYEVMESEQPIYQKVDGVWKDVWPLRPMTNAEKTAKQQAAITAFNNREQAENWAAWTFNEELCEMVPPIPRPAPDFEKLNQRIYTFWCGADNNWRDTPVMPEGNYKFDFINWIWIENNDGNSE